MKKIYVIFLLLISTCSFSQWNASAAINNTVCVQSYDQVNSKVITDMKGGAIIVWEDYRNDPTLTKADIYAQRIDADGNTLWQANGIVICNDTTHQSGVTAVADSSGGAFIVWQDHRNPKKNLYAQRVDSSGNVSWTANGVGVTLRNFDQQKPKIINDGSHGLIVLWMDSVGGAYDIYGQRLDSSGTALWPNGVGICTVPLSQINPKGFMSSSGEIYAIWQDKRNGSDYDIYAQKLNLSGAAQWTANGIAVCNVAGTQSNPRIAQDGGGGAIAVWQDKRSGVDYDIFAQRLNSSGVVQWTANGIGICTATGTQNSVDLTTQNISNGAIFAWKDQRSTTLNNSDIYAQMVNLSGVVQWAANGIAIANANFNQTSPNVIHDGIGGAIISYQDSSGGSWDIKSQRVNSAGTLLWSAGGANVGIASGDQTNQSNIASGIGNSIYTFQDTRSGNNDIYAYKLDQNGTVVGITQLSGAIEKVQVYPNPSNDKVIFLLNQTENWKLKITDLNGKEIMKEEIIYSDSYTLTKKLEAGIYFYSITDAKNQIKGKFVILN